MSDNVHNASICPRCNGGQRVYVEFIQALRRRVVGKIVYCPQCDGSGFIYPGTELLTDTQFKAKAKKARAL